MNNYFDKLSNDIEMDIIDRATELQTDMNAFIEKMKSYKEGNKLSYEICISIYFLIKIAELEKKLENQYLSLKN